MAGIIYADYYLPENTVPAAEILKVCLKGQENPEVIADGFINQTKLENILIENKYNPVQIFNLLLENFAAKSGVPAGEVSHIIYTASFNLMKESVCIPYLLQAGYNFTSASIILMEQGCVSVMQAMQMAEALIEAGKAECVLILALSYGFKTEERFIGTTILADGAGILAVGKDRCQFTIKDSIAKSDGLYSLNEYRKIPQRADHLGVTQVIKKGADLTKEFLRNKALNIKDIKAIVPQNVNYYGNYIYARFLGTEIDKVFLRNIALGGHLSEVDTIRNYTDFARENSLNKGDMVLLYACGTVGMGNSTDATYDVMLLRAE